MTQTRRLQWVPFLLYGALMLYVFFNKEYQRETRTFQNDKGGYYVYLPALVISGDLAELRAYHAANERLRLNGDPDYGTHVHPRTGRRVNKYPVGVAMAQAAPFLVAHGLAGPLGYAADGYTAPYVVAIAVSCALLVALGLWWLFRLLRRYFSGAASWATVAAVGFGTNLYYYTAFEPGMSHSYSFGVLCGCFLAADRWYRRGASRDLLWLSAFAGWAVIMRPLNALYFLPLLLWNAGSAAALRERGRFFLRHMRQLIPAILVFLLATLPQLAYWRYTSGSWLYYSYGEEGFHWADPHVWDGLFSYRKGWFVYTPLAFAAALGFLTIARRPKRSLLLPIFAAMLLLVYVTFCWHDWTYGGSFGCRPLIESFVLMAFPLAAVVHAAVQSPSVLARVGIGALLVAGISLNLFQSYQFSFGSIHYAQMNRDYYWRIFGKVHASDDDWKLLKLD